MRGCHRRFTDEEPRPPAHSGRGGEGSSDHGWALTELGGPGEGPAAVPIWDWCQGRCRRMPCVHAVGTRAPPLPALSPSPQARDVYEEAIRTVMTVRDFTQVFDSYAQFEESMIAAKMETASELGREEEGKLEVSRVAGSGETWVLESEASREGV